MIPPERGEVWLADCGLAAKVRPVAVVSIPYAETDRVLITVIPHTTSLFGSQFEVSLKIHWLAAGAFNIQAIFPLVPERFIRKLGDLTTDQMAKLETVLKKWEGLR